MERVTPEVDLAITELREAFLDHQIEVDPEEQGGAYVIVHGLPVGSQYVPATTWVGFLVNFQYPRADTYPHFVAPDLQRTDAQPLGESFSGPTEWHGRSGIQVSRRSPHLDPTVDTAVTKLAKVLDWIRSR